MISYNILTTDWWSLAPHILFRFSPRLASLQVRKVKKAKRLKRYLIKEEDRTQVNGQ